ncbi:hypothetical protein BH23GEM9_BH23GEM9_04530 [soil metagenome]
MPTRTAVPRAADIAAIAGRTDAVLRNLLITHCYHELAVALRTHTGPRANWCTFATWASRQAGRTIRGEDLHEALLARFSALPETRAVAAALLAGASSAASSVRLAGIAGELVRAIELDGALARASAAVAAGNLKVFAEIAAEFARFLAALAQGESVDAFLDSLRDGDPPDGQRLLKDAFAAYREALSAGDAGLRAQLLHYANLLIGLHEQTRLQPEIAAAMNCAFDADAVRSRLLERLLPGVWRRWRYRAAALLGRRPPLDDLLDRLLAAAQAELRRLVTANAMTLEFPGRTLRLGRDVAGTHAPSLARITEPRLAALLRRVDLTPDDVRGSAAADWSVLEQRMHFIADLFRCHHEVDTLFSPPYTSVQLAALRAGRMPAPPL